MTEGTRRGRGTAALGCDSASGGSAPLAQPAQASYRRNLPHLQRPTKAVFVTFSTYKRWELPESVRGAVLEHCLFVRKGLVNDVNDYPWLWREWVEGAALEAQ